MVLCCPSQQLRGSLGVLTSICTPEHTSLGHQSVCLATTDTLNRCRVGQSKALGGFGNQLGNLAEGLIELAQTPRLAIQCSTYQQTDITDEVEAVLVPQFTFSALKCLLNELDKHTTQVGNVDVASGALSLAHLDRLPGLDRDAGNLGNLDTALVDRTLALAIDDGWEDQSGLGACDLQKIVIHNPCARIFVDDIAKFWGVVDVVEEFTRGVAKPATRNIGDGQHACAGNLDPVS